MVSFNNPFPRQPRSLGFVQGKLLFRREVVKSADFAVGEGFVTSWNVERGGTVSVFHRSEPGRNLWSSSPGGIAFVTAALGSETVKESRGSFNIQDDIHAVCKYQTVESVFGSVPESDGELQEDDADGTSSLGNQGPSVTFTGFLCSHESDALEQVFGKISRGFSHRLRSKLQQRVLVRYRLTFSEKRDRHLGFAVKLDQPRLVDQRRVSRSLNFPEGNTFEHDLFHSSLQESGNASKTPRLNRIQLTYSSDENEGFYGFGEQFSCFDLKGRRVPILVQEQGLGRGDQPVTAAANLISYRSGGSWHTTYAPSPYYMTSRMRCFFLENYEYSLFDLTHRDRVQVHVHASSMKGRILHGTTPLELIKRYTDAIGRMRELPDWILRGAIVGMQGGTDAVKRVFAQLKEHDVPVAAFWLQDWVGQRKTKIGWQLWWNWELDTEHYHGWKDLVKQLKMEGIQIMTYCNPFVAAVEEKENKVRNLLQEAKDNGFTVTNSEGKAYMIMNTSFDAGMVDITNPEARSWLKCILREMVATGVRGWMADFGEALPFNSTLYSGENGAAIHNKFPELWAKLNREFVEEWEQETNEQLVFFMRAGFRQSPKWSTLFWEGDQMVSWQKNDGIKSAVLGLLSSGISGYSLNHSDIGGYTTVDVPLLKYVRSEELLFRWMELNAFSAIFRTHEGNAPTANAQFYTSDATLRHFSRCAKLYKAWERYRKQLVKEAASSGLPVVRHLFLHYPTDECVQKITYEQFLVGAEILVAPVLDEGKNSVWVYFPSGDDEWEHVWTNKVYGHSMQKACIQASVGFPAVFAKKNSVASLELLDNLKKMELKM